MVDKVPLFPDALKVNNDGYDWWDSPADRDRFLIAAKGSRYYNAYQLALETGMRLGEIVGLSKDDVNFDRCQIHVHRQWLEKQGCYGPPKHNREPFISLDPNSGLIPLLRKAIADSPDLEAIFVARTGVRVRNRKLAGDHFADLIKKAGVKSIRFHDLRHTFASWYMIEVGDIWSLRGILEHQDIATTQRYAHLSQKHQRAPVFSWTEKRLILHSPSEGSPGKATN